MMETSTSKMQSPSSREDKGENVSGPQHTQQRQPQHSPHTPHRNESNYKHDQDDQFSFTKHDEHEFDLSFENDSEPDLQLNPQPQTPCQRRNYNHNRSKPAERQAADTIPWFHAAKPPTQPEPEHWQRFPPGRPDLNPRFGGYKGSRLPPGALAAKLIMETKLPGIRARQTRQTGELARLEQLHPAPETRKPTATDWLRLWFCNKRVDDDSDGDVEEMIFPYRFVATPSGGRSRVPAVEYSQMLAQHEINAIQKEQRWAQGEIPRTPEMKYTPSV